MRSRGSVNHYRKNRLLSVGIMRGLFLDVAQMLEKEVPGTLPPSLGARVSHLPYLLLTSQVLQVLGVKAAIGSHSRIRFSDSLLNAPPSSSQLASSKELGKRRLVVSVPFLPGLLPSIIPSQTVLNTTHRRFCSIIHTKMKMVKKGNSLWPLKGQLINNDTGIILRNQ